MTLCSWKHEKISIHYHPNASLKLQLIYLVTATLFLQFHCSHFSIVLLKLIWTSIGRLLQCYIPSGTSVSFAPCLLYGVYNFGWLLILRYWFWQELFNMSTPQIDPLLQVETTCGTLLYELQVLRNIPHNRYLNFFSFS